MNTAETDFSATSHRVTPPPLTYCSLMCCDRHSKLHRPWAWRGTTGAGHFLSLPKGTRRKHDRIRRNA